MRIIDQLRRLFPTEKWHYSSASFLWSNGKDTVMAFAVAAPRYEGDDDNFRTEYRLNWPPGTVLQIEKPKRKR